jgi:hypothetical protein
VEGFSRSRGQASGEMVPELVDVVLKRCAVGITHLVARGLDEVRWR